MKKLKLPMGIDNFNAPLGSVKSGFLSEHTGSIHVPSGT